MSVEESVSVKEFCRRMMEVAPELKQLQGSFVFALNWEYVDADADCMMIQKGDEIALIPPVSGG